MVSAGLAKRVRHGMVRAWSLLLSWAPVIGDALTLVAGMLRVRLATFLGPVTLAKGGLRRVGSDRVERACLERSSILR